MRGNSLCTERRGKLGFARGAAVLHLSGLCGDETRARALGTERLGSSESRSKGLLKWSETDVPIHIADIALIISFLYEVTELQGAPGCRLLVTSGAYLSQDIVRLCGLDPIPEKPFPDPSMAGSKFVRNSQLCNLMPDGFAFTPPMPGLQPQPCPPSEGRS